MLPEELGQAKAQGQGGGKDQPGIGHQAVVVKEDADTVGFVLWQHLLGAPCFRGGFLFQNHYPRFTGAPSSFFKGWPQGRPSVDSGQDVGQDRAHLETRTETPYWEEVFGQ